MTGPRLRQTHTLATMELSELAYQEVKGYLLEADWTADHDRALRFVRRQDAESFCAQDEDAWCITPYLPLTTENGAPMQITISTTGVKAEVLQRLREPGSAGTLSAGVGVSPPNELEHKIRQAITEHLQHFARDEGNVTITASISLNYQAYTDHDGNEVPARADAKHS